MRALLIIAAISALALPQQPVTELRESLRANPTDLRVWKAIATHKDVARALDVARECREQIRKDPRILGEFVDLACRSGDYALGLDAGTTALAQLDAVGDVSVACDLRIRLAKLHYHFGASEAERRLLLRCREDQLKSKLDTTVTDRCLTRLDAETRFKQFGKTEELEAAIQRHLEQSEFPRAHDALLNLGLQKWHEKDLRGGLAAYRRALELRPKLEVSKLRDGNVWNGAARLALDLALSLGEGDEQNTLLAEARRFGESALKSHASAFGTGLYDRLRDHCVLAQTYEALGERDLARLHFREELEVVREQRAQIAPGGQLALRALHGERHHIYNDHALFLARESPSDPKILVQALEIFDEAALGALAEVLTERGLQSPSWMTATSRMEEILARTKSRSVAVVCFLFGTHDAGAIVLEAGTARFVPLSGPVELEKKAIAFTRACLHLESSPKEIAGAGEEAYQAFLDPLFKTQGLPNRLILIGAGRFGDLPFGALVRPGDGWMGTRCVAASTELSQAPSLQSVLAQKEARPIQLVSFGVEASPKLVDELSNHFRTRGLPSLSRASFESKTFVKTLGGQGAIAAKATEALFRRTAGRATLLHIACHAVVDDEDAGRTALLLGAGDGHDGLVTLGDIVDLKLNADLVILSGCRTAQGENYVGEGLRGLARAFFAAGAQALIAAGTPVDDGATERFMAELAKGLHEGNSPARALVLAQRRFLADRATSHPALWSAFSLHTLGGLEP